MNVLTKEDWMAILMDSTLTREFAVEIFQGLYVFEGHRAPAKHLAVLLGYNSHAPFNSEIGRYAKRIATHYDIEFSERKDRGRYKYWDLFFLGQNKEYGEETLFEWKIRPELVAALEELSLVECSSFPVIAYEEDLSDLYEGAKKTVTVNHYERNPRARDICINHWGVKCCVCGFNFFEAYGPLGGNYIHVHHLIPLSQIGRIYRLDPIKDLRPICPNCHAMIHSKKPPLTIENLREMVAKK